MKRRLVKIISLITLVALMALQVFTLSGCGEKNYVEMKVKGFGTVIIELYPDVAPITVENFTTLVEEGFYDGLTFHRIMANFMIQGGMPSKNSREVEPIFGEFALNGFNNTLSHSRGVISMARTEELDSATSQFFICNTDYPYLDGSYAAFGKVIEGIEVVDAITEYGIRYTIGGIIYDEEYRPVIESMRMVRRY